MILVASMLVAGISSNSFQNLRPHIELLQVSVSRPQAKQWAFPQKVPARDGMKGSGAYRNSCFKDIRTKLQKNSHYPNSNADPRSIGVFVKN